LPIADNRVDEMVLALLLQKKLMRPVRTECQERIAVGCIGPVLREGYI
jgi:hypothetical protein